MKFNIGCLVVTAIVAVVLFFSACRTKVEFREVVIDEEETSILTSSH